MSAFLNWVGNTWRGGGLGRAGLIAGGLGLGALGYSAKRKYQIEQRNHERAMQEYYDRINAQNQSYNPGDGGLAAYQNMIDARNENIQSAMQRVNEMYGGREGLYDDYADASYGLAKDYLDDEKQKAGLALRDSLARAGLSAGSVDIDKHAELEKRYLSGLSSARSAADSAAAGLAAQDASQRNSLLGLAAGGMVDGDMLAQMYTPPQQVSASVPQVGLGNTFVGLVDYIGATRNPFRIGGGVGAGYARPDAAGGSQYTGTVVS